MYIHTGYILYIIRDIHTCMYHVVHDMNVVCMYNMCTYVCHVREASCMYVQCIVLLTVVLDMLTLYIHVLHTYVCTSTCMCVCTCYTLLLVQVRVYTRVVL